MGDWVQVFRENKRLLTFGFLFSFFSSFGQTFFVSLYVPFWIQSLDISNTAFGTLYATVTVVAAVLISFSGKYIDTIPLKNYALFVFGGLTLSVLLLSQAKSLVLLTAGLFLVRWLGQGLMTHTSSTGIAKFFEGNRGKALSFSAMGHPAGHFLLPFIMLPLIAFAGWSNSLIILSLIALLIMIPVILAIAPVCEAKSMEEKNNVKDSVKPAHTNHFKSLDFWIISLNIFALPFILTAVFLYQYTIGEARGWSVSWVAFSFSFFAIFSAIGLLISGNLTDRFSGLFLFPLYLIPAILGVLMVTISDSQYVFPAFYALVGIASGLGSTIKTATQTEIYGTGNLGKVRSYFSTILVLSTALGPPVFAFLLDRNVPFNIIMAFSGLLIILSSLASFRLWPLEYFSRMKALANVWVGKTKTRKSKP